MEQDRFCRTQRILGADAMKTLANASVAVFGLGGVGSYTASALARCGVGRIALFDADTVSVTNINRQLIAFESTVGMLKTEVMKRQILDINPDVQVQAYPIFLDAQSAKTVDFSQYSYVADAIDTVSSKLLLAKLCKESNTPLISCMGTGNKLDPTRFRVTDIYKTSGCPLARVMRRELRKRGILSLKVVYSDEPPIVCDETAPAEQKGSAGRMAPGSISFVPPVAGLILASEIIKALLG